MIDKRTFCKLLDGLDCVVTGIESLEIALHVTFDNNFLTRHLDDTLTTLSESFFTQEQIEDIENQTSIETIKDILYHYAFNAEFGLKTGLLQRLYVEDEGLASEYAMNAFNSEQLYEVIMRYLEPPRICKTYTIHC